MGVDPEVLAVPHQEGSQWVQGWSAVHHGCPFRLDWVFLLFKTGFFLSCVVLLVINGFFLVIVGSTRAFLSILLPGLKRFALLER